MMRSRLLAVLGVTVLLTLWSSTAQAQLETFVEGIRALARATGQAEPLRSNDIRAAANRLGMALVEWDRRISALEAAIGREIPAAPPQRAYRLHVELGVVYRVRGRISDASREFDAAVALQPSASDLQVLRALTLEAAGRSEEAGAAFLAAWNLDPGNPVKAYYVTQRPGAGSQADRARARALLTDTYRRLAFADHQAPAAPFVTLDALSDNLSDTPVIADNATFDAFAALSARKYGDAVAMLGRRDQPERDTAEDSPLANFARGQRDEAQNRVADAQREYHAALAGALVGRHVLLVAIARLAQVEGNPAGAIGAFAEAAQLNPNEPNIRKELASAYAAEGRTDEAFCELMAAVLINPRDAQVHAAIGQLYLDTGRDAEAVAAFDRALELAPERYEIRYALATAHSRLGNSRESARQLELYDRLRRAALERRRADLANSVEREEAPGTGVPAQGAGR